MVASDGGIFFYGDAGFHGSAGSLALNRPIVGMASTPDGGGYWLVASDGGIFSYSDAGFHGSAGSLALNRPIVGMASTPDGGGYWLVASDGGIFSYGDAGFHGSAGSLALNRPIVGMASTPDGGGYWLVASDGGIFSYGDAGFHGSAGSLALNRPIVGMASTPDGGGYWLVASDGGIFSYGDAGFHGSAGSLALNRPIVGMASTPDGGGYWLVASDGGIFSYGDAGFHGSAGSLALNRPIVGMATSRPTLQSRITSQGGLYPPPGYTSRQFVFDDQFSGNTLDSSKWTTYMAGQGGAFWNGGGLASGDSAAGTGTHETYFSPEQDTVNGGLSLSMVPDMSHSNLGYTTRSGVVTSYQKWSLATGYVQIEAQLPDSSAGGWPAIWLLDPNGDGSNQEIDLQEGGFTSGTGLPTGTPENDVFVSTYHTPSGAQSSFSYATPTAMNTGEHVYGVEYLPGQSIKTYFDGQLVGDWTTDISTLPYELVLWNAQASSGAGAYHTSGSPNTSTMTVAEVQAYSD